MVIHGDLALWTCPARTAPTMTNAHPLTLVPVLPAPALRATRFVLADDGAVVLEARTAGREARCPACHQLTARVQSRYRRTLADLPTQGASVRVRLKVRRFRCATHGCARRIFTERLAPFAAPYARRTTRLTAAHTRVEMLTGGAARRAPAHSTDDDRKRGEATRSGVTGAVFARRTMRAEARMRHAACSKTPRGATDGRPSPAAHPPS
jgi:hypothetical protein